MSPGVVSREEAPSQEPRLPLLVGAAIWVGIGIAFFASTTAQLALLGQQQPAWHTLWDASSVFLFYGLSVVPALELYRRIRPASPDLAGRVVPAVVAWLVFHALAQFSFTAVEYGFIAPLRGGEELFYLALVRYHAVRRAPVSMLIFLGAIFFVENRRAAWALAREEQRRLHVSAELTTARLAALSGQLHPHFLFNTLNAIASLVRSNPGAAERMIERLSDLLRAALAEGHEATIPLRREFDLIDDYLAIHAARFPDRFHYSLALPDGLHSFPVPPLLLQPLVENAIRHGLDQRVAGGRLEVHAVTTDGDALRLVVDDDGVGVRLPLTRLGVGLRNVESRLGAIYGGKAVLEVAPRVGGGTRATLILPRLTTSPQVQEH
jgi:signal transduction histidine kinase